MVAESPEEKKIQNLLEEAGKSQELVDFAEQLKDELAGIQMPFYSYRVKKVHSAIRTFRLAGHHSWKDVQDLFGVLIVTESEKDIPMVAEKIRKKLTEYTEYDLITERDWIAQKEARERGKRLGCNELLEQLKCIFANIENLEKVLPPYSHLILSHLSFGDKTIPVEFRIQSKTGFQIVEAGYFTLYKNDEVNPKIKAPLLFVEQQLLSRKIKLDTQKLTKPERVKLLYEMGELYQDNFNLLCQNRETLLDVWREFVKISAKYELQLPVYDFHFFGEKNKTEEEMEQIDQELDRIFTQYQSFDIREIDTKEYIKQVVCELKVGMFV